MYLSIIIITHNSSEVVDKCLSSLNSHPPSCSFETIVVDNASSDDTVKLIQNDFPEVRLLPNDINKGYSRGINQGISASKGEMILILNPDIIVREGAVDRLVDFMKKHPEAGISGSRLENTDGSLQYSCRSFYTVRALLLRRTFLGKIFPRAKSLREHLLTDFDHRTVREVDWLIGACMMVRRSAIENAGMMDERFFLYFEDVDWCYRMKQHGWKVYYVPGSVMTHYYERASAGSLINRSLLIHLVSLLRYYEKWNRISYFLKRHRSVFKSMVFILSDFIAINASFLLAYYLRLAADPLFVNSLYPLSWYKYFVIFYNMIFFLAFLFGGLYRIHRETTGAEEFGRVIKVVMAGMAVLVASTYLSRIRMYSRAVIIAQAFFSVGSVLLLRRMVRSIHRVFVRAGFDQKRVLLAGSPAEVEAFRENISSSPELGIDIAGCLNQGGNSLGSVEDTAAILDRFKVQEIFIFPSFQSRKKVRYLMEEAFRGTVQISLVSAVGQFLGAGVRVSRMGNSYILSAEQGAVVRMRLILIRIFEIMLSIPLILFSSLCHIILRIFSLLGGKVEFSSEKRYSFSGPEVSWPRVIFKSGREGSDLFKPSLFARVLQGSLRLIGSPPLLRKFERSPAGTGCGISGRWRVSPRHFDLAALKDEAVEINRITLSGYMIMLTRSIPWFITGKYPGWFYKEELK
ncbi:MAG: glycosyltransferase [Candidatus Latescibacteria bacterium]|nr:glycosyltransferase [bacterium]MBD3422876.1 glycosyltransferase [Candidatus Latescibacterota bacterium]